MKNEEQKAANELPPFIDKIKNDILRDVLFILYELWKRKWAQFVLIIVAMVIGVFFAQLLFDLYTKIDPLNRKIVHLEAEVEFLTNKIKKLQEQSFELEKNNRKLQVESEALKDEVNKLNEKLKSLYAQFEQFSRIKVETLPIAIDEFQNFLKDKNFLYHKEGVDLTDSEKNFIESAAITFAELIQMELAYKELCITMGISKQEAKKYTGFDHESIGHVSSVLSYCGKKLMAYKVLEMNKILLDLKYDRWENKWQILYDQLKDSSKLKATSGIKGPG